MTWFKRSSQMNSRGFEREVRLIRERLDSLERNIMANLDDLKAAVAENTTVVQSAVVAINGLADKLQEAVNNDSWAGVQDVIDTMRTDDTALAAAITARTVAVGEPAPTPVEPVVEPIE